MRTYKQLVRVLTLAKRLQGCTVLPEIATLATEFRVSNRTIYRDLAALEAAHWMVPRRWLDDHLSEGAA